MDAMSPAVRIGLRYFAGILMGAGYIKSVEPFTDPDLVTVVCYSLAGACTVLSESWYWAAHKFGWAK